MEGKFFFIFLLNNTKVFSNDIVDLELSELSDTCNKSNEPETKEKKFKVNDNFEN